MPSNEYNCSKITIIALVLYFFLGAIGCESIELGRVVQVTISTPEWDEVEERYKVFGNISDFSNEAIVYYGHTWSLQSSPSLNSPDSTTFFFKEDYVTRNISFYSDLNRLIGIRKYFVWAYLILEDGEVVFSKPDSISQTKFESFLELVHVEGGIREFKDPLDPSGVSKNIEFSSFKIGKYEVTQAFWEFLMKGNPSYHLSCELCPVDQVSIEQIEDFLSELNRKTNRKFRLPSEAEWEYAAQGGIYSQNFTYSGSNDIFEVGWFRRNVPFTISQPVGLLKPNELDIHDLSGNVSELCRDRYTQFPIREWVLANPFVADIPSSTTTGLLRVQRGGSYTDFETTYLKNNGRGSRDGGIYVDGGFRIVEEILN